MHLKALAQCDDMPLPVFALRGFVKLQTARVSRTIPPQYDTGD